MGIPSNNLKTEIQNLIKMERRSPFRYITCSIMHAKSEVLRALAQISGMFPVTNTPAGLPLAVPPPPPSMTAA